MLPKCTRYSLRASGPLHQGTACCQTEAKAPAPRSSAGVHLRSQAGTAARLQEQLLAYGMTRPISMMHLGTSASKAKEDRLWRGRPRFSALHDLQVCPSPVSCLDEKSHTAAAVQAPEGTHPRFSQRNHAGPRSLHSCPHLDACADAQVEQAFLLAPCLRLQAARP